MSVRNSLSVLGRRLAALVVLTLPVALTAGLGVGAGYAASRLIRIPRVNELANYRPDIVTEIRGADGSTVARFAIERRDLIDRPQIPDVMVKSLLATEDARFYEHGGIDIVRIGGAALRDLASRSLAQGASTITQQLARSVFLTPQKSFARKLNEVFLTVEIEKRYSKDQILTMYLNQIYFGHGNYGVEAASKWYFGHTAKELNLEEAALLAGIIQRPEYYSPVRNPEGTTQRRNFVLRRMAEERYIEPALAQQAMGRPLVLSKNARESVVGPYFCEEVRQYLEKAYGEKGLYRQGLRVDSTMDPRIQLVVEKQLRWGLRRADRRGGYRRPRNLVKEGIDPETYRDPSWDGTEDPDVKTAVVMGVTKAGLDLRIGNERLTLPPVSYRWTRSDEPGRGFARGDVVLVETATSEEGKTETFISQDPNVEGAAVVIENGTGAVRAIVGGYDFERSKFNRAVQALRQVGSAFKPFVYLTAVEAGFTPADTVLDSPISITIDPRQPAWQPQNYYRKYNGIVTYQYALEQSINVPAVRVDLLVSTRKVIDTARRLGIKQRMLAYPSLALGSFEVTPLEMTAAYSVFANQGLYFTPRLVERVRDAEGRLLEENPADPHDATTPGAAYVMLGMLKGVTERGTAATAKKLDMQLAGKTGTTNDHTDAWFVGTSPRYTIGVWVGHESKKTLGSKATGAEVALPIWMRIVKGLKDEGLVKPSDDYDVPPGIVFVPIDLMTGYRATPGCAKVVLTAFVNGTQPTEFCGDHPHAVSNLPHYLQKAAYTPKRGESSAAEVQVDDPKPAAPAVEPPPVPTPRG